MQPGWRKTKNAEVISHWSKPFGNFFTPPTEFYASVEKAVVAHEIPDLEVSRVTWRESGFLSADREYLRLERKRYIYDICAAPFGKDYFFSSWLVMLRPSLTVNHWTGMFISVFALTFLFTWVLGTIKGLFFLVVALGFIWWLVQSGTLKMEIEIEELLLGLTVIGAIREVFYRPPTYYEIDTALMFHSVVHTAVIEVIDGITESKGLPRLSESERKPTKRDFFKK
jgi:hypothetical protein